MRPECERVAEWIVLTQLRFKKATEREHKKENIAHVLHEEFCGAEHEREPTDA